MQPASRLHTACGECSLHTVVGRPLLHLCSPHTPVCVVHTCCIRPWFEHRCWTVCLSTRSTEGYFPADKWIFMIFHFFPQWTHRARMSDSLLETLIEAFKGKACVFWRTDKRQTDRHPHLSIQMLYDYEISCSETDWQTDRQTNIT